MRLIGLAVIAGCGGGGISAAVDPDTPTDEGDSDTDVDADVDTDADADADTDTDPTGVWSHTAIVDGDCGEFATDEQFVTSGGTTFITWDADALYICVQHGDVATGGPEHWALIYVGNGTGATQGELIGTQQPALPTAFSHLLRFKLDDSYNDLATWSKNQWTLQAGYLAKSGFEKAKNNQVVEFRIPFSGVGAGDGFAVHVNLLFEGAGFESTYSPVPTSSHEDGYDPDYSSYYLFDRLGVRAPSSYLPL